MSALSFITAKAPAFQYPQRYCFHADEQDEAAVIALPTASPTQKVTLRGALQILGQFCATAQNGGVIFPREYHQALREAGVHSVTTRKRWRRQLVAAGVMEVLDDGYFLPKFAKHNRTPEQWADAKARRAQYKAEWQRQKRAEARALKRAQRAANDDGVTTPGGHQWPPPDEESPHTACIFNISGGDDSHYRGQRCESEPDPPLRSPAQAAPQGEPSAPPTSPVHLPPLPRSTRPKGQRCESEPGSPIATKLGGSLLSPVIPLRIGTASAGRSSLGVSQKQNRGAHVSADADPRWGGEAKAKAKAKAGKAKAVGEVEALFLNKWAAIQRDRVQSPAGGEDV